MRNTFLLIKNYFNCFLGNLFKRKNQVMKYGSAILLLLGISAIFVYLFVSLAITSTTEAIEFGNPKIALYLTASMALIFIMLMTITKSTTPFRNSDDEQLLALPVTKTNIVIAKLFYDYLFDLAIVGMTLLPSLIVYVVLVPDVSMFLLLRGIVLILVLPLLSSSLGLFISLFFTLIARYFKYYGLIQSLFTLIVLVVFMGAYYGLTVLSNSQTMGATSLIMNFYPIKIVVEFIYNCDIPSLIVILACTLIPFIICVIIKSYLLGRTMNRYNARNKTLKYKESSPVKSLYKREVSRYFNIPMYVTNTAFGGILLIIIGFILLALGKNYIYALLSTVDLDGMLKYFTLIIVFIIEFSLATICTTAASVSLEGKQLWILKAHPVATKDIFIAKILLNVTISSIPGIIGVFIISITIGYIYLPVLILMVILSSIITGMIGLMCNLNYPKLEWDNETIPIKQGMSTLVSMGLNIIALNFPLIIYIMLTGIVYDILALLIVCGVYIIIIILLWYKLKTSGVKIFNELNN